MPQQPVSFPFRKEVHPPLSQQLAVSTTQAQDHTASLPEPGFCIRRVPCEAPLPPLQSMAEQHGAALLASGSKTVHNPAAQHQFLHPKSQQSPANVRSLKSLLAPSLPWPTAPSRLQLRERASVFMFSLRLCETPAICVSESLHMCLMGNYCVRNTS